MGTGILAVVAAAFPAGVPVVRTASEVFWLIAVTLLVLLTTALVRHWIRRRDDALADARSHTMFPFYGAVSMAVLTVGAGTGSAGHALLGDVAVPASATLWRSGPASGSSPTPSWPAG